MFELGTLAAHPPGTLVQQSPHHHARMVAVPLDQRPDLIVAALLVHARRVIDQPPASCLLVDQKTDFIRQFQLAPITRGLEKPDGIESHRLHGGNIEQGPVGVIGHPQTEGILLAGMGAAQENPFPIQPEAAVFHAKVPKTAADDPLIIRIRALLPDFSRDCIKKRILQIPQTGIFHLELCLHRGSTRRKNLLQGMGTVSRYHGKEQVGGNGGRASVFHRPFDRNGSGLPVRPDEDIFKIYRRIYQQFHRIFDAGLGEDIAAGNLAPNQAVNTSLSGIHDADRQNIFVPGTYGIRGVQDKRGVRSLVFPQIDPVQPDGSLVPHGPAFDQAAAAGMRVGRRGETVPVPGHAVVAGKGILDHPGNPGGDGSRLDGLVPLLADAKVGRIGLDLPC
ncbi:MAG: hypothetical protein BWY71_00621 [Planctomycetes bacterium ADurb.Bin412]|nr:MAG: hypothetical protein BWY71_00621 [Planctomycetes bacterium ADurb.Bin412]